MNSTNTSDLSIHIENKIYSPQQVYSVGSFPVFFYPDIYDTPTIEDPFKKTTERIETWEPIISKEKDIFESAKKYYKEKKRILLKKYKNKHIAILNNKIIGSGKDFSKLAQRVYEKYGYQAIYIPFVTKEEKIVKILSPKIKNF